MYRIIGVIGLIMCLSMVFVYEALGFGWILRLAVLGFMVSGLLTIVDNDECVYSRKEDEA